MATEDEAAAFTEVLHNAPPVKLSNLVKINDYEFVGAALSKTAGLYKYNTLSNEWKCLIKYPANFKPKYHRICYDEVNKIIYLHGDAQQMVIFRLHTLNVEIIESGINTGSWPELSMINGECHVILGGDSTSDYKWNSKLKQFEKVFEFDFPYDANAYREYSPHDGVCGHRIIHIKSQNKSILFGGYDQSNDEYLDDIWECNHNYDKNNYTKWKKLSNIKLPIGMCDFGIILTKNEDYVIMFGGDASEWDMEGIKSILILDLDEMKFYQSKIKLPSKDRIYAVSMGNEKSCIVLSGYTKRIQREYDMNIPTELTQCKQRSTNVQSRVG